MNQSLEVQNKPRDRFDWSIWLQARKYSRTVDNYILSIRWNNHPKF